MTISMRNSLGYLGLIPFISLLFYFIVLDNAVNQSLLLVFSSYSAAIASFLAGTLWGQSLYNQHINRLALLLISNIFTVLVWSAFLLIIFDFFLSGLSVFLAVFLGLYWVEKSYIWQIQSDQLSKARAQGGYRHLRQRLTLTVVVCHIVVIALLLKGAL